MGQTGRSGARGGEGPMGTAADGGRGGKGRTIFIREGSIRQKLEDNRSHRAPGCIGRGGGTPPPPRAASLRPATVSLTPSAGFNGIRDRQ